MPNAPVFAKMRGRPQKSNSLSSAQKLVVSKIAKKVVMKASETKSWYSNVPSTGLFPSSVYATNLIYPIQQGTTADNIVGEKMFIKNIRIKLQLLSQNNASAGNTPATIRTAIIKTKKALTNTTSTVTSTDVFRSSTGPISMVGHFDLHKVDLLYDKIHTLPQTSISNVDTLKVHEINLKVNKAEYFDTDNGGYLKNKNYYLIVVSDKADVTIGANSGFMRGTWTVNFKDD